MHINYEKWYDKYSSLANELAELNHIDIYTKEKYWRVDISEWWGVNDIVFETFRDYEDMSENTCQHCVKHRKQICFENNWWCYHFCIWCYMKYLFAKLLEKCWLRNKNKPL